MVCKVNVFQNLNCDKDIRIVLTKPEVITRVEKGFKRMIKSFCGEISEKQIAEWKEQCNVEMR